MLDISQDHMVVPTKFGGNPFLVSEKNMDKQTNKLFLNFSMV